MIWELLSSWAKLVVDGEGHGVDRSDMHAMTMKLCKRIGWDIANSALFRLFMRVVHALTTPVWLAERGSIEARGVFFAASTLTKMHVGVPVLRTLCGGIICGGEFSVYRTAQVNAKQSQQFMRNEPLL